MGLRLIASLAVVAVAVFIGVFWFVTRAQDNGDQFAGCRASQIAGGAGTIGGPFELVNAAGETVTDTDVITEPSILYFGYTFCPDVCPLDVARNAAAVDVLAMPLVPMLVQVLLAVDPVERRRDRRHEGAGRELEVEHQRGVVGRFDGLHHLEERLAGARHALRRKDDLVVCCLDVRRGQRGFRRGTSHRTGS